MSELSNGIKKHTSKSCETIPLTMHYLCSESTTMRFFFAPKQSYMSYVTAGRPAAMALGWYPVALLHPNQSGQVHGDKGQQAHRPLPIDIVVDHS
jgi:hypothetical protein